MLEFNYRRLFYLFVTKFNQLVVPLIVYPLCISSVGLENFGFVAFWTGINAFLAKLIGLNMDSYSSRVVRKAESYQKLFYAICIPVIIKVTLLIIALPLSLFFTYFYVEELDLVTTALLCIYPLLAAAFSINHFVIGTGKFEYLAISSFFEKLIVLVVILFFLNDETDLLFIPLAYVLGTASSLFITWFLVKKYIVKIRVKNIVVLFKRYILVARWLVIGKLFQLHMNAAKVLVGIFFDYKAVAIFDIAEKLVNISKIPLSILADFLFSNKTTDYKYFIKLLAFKLFVGFSMFLILNIFGDLFIIYFVKNEYVNEMFTILKYMSYILLATPFIMVFGSNYIVKFLDVETYGKLLTLSNVFSIFNLFLWWIFFSNSLEFFALWVVSCEVVFAMFCSIYFFKEVKINEPN